MDFSLRFVSIIWVGIVLLSTCQIGSGQEKWGAKFPYMTILFMGEQTDVNVTLFNLNKDELIETQAKIRLVSDSSILNVAKTIPTSEINGGGWHGSFRIEAVFIGGAKVYAEIARQNNDVCYLERSKKFLRVQVIRKAPLWMYKVEYYEIYETTLYLLTRLALGMVIDWHVIRDIFTHKPIGIGTSTFFTAIFMPLLGFVLGFIVFPEDNSMQFVLLALGACLTKGVSNFWTVILDGNIDLSVSMSVINTVLSCAVIPLWMLTLGRTKFPDEQITIPYLKVGVFIFYATFPFLVGIIIRTIIYCFCSLSRVKRYLLILLRFLSLFYILSITADAVATVVDLLTPNAIAATWTYILAGLFMPVIGYTVAYLVACLFGQHCENGFAIAVETINFNPFIVLSMSAPLLTGTSPKELALLLSKLVLICTPIPLLVHYVWVKFRPKKNLIKITTKEEEEENMAA